MADLGSGVRCFGPGDPRPLRLRFASEHLNKATDQRQYFFLTPDPPTPLSIAAEKSKRKNMTNLSKEKIENLKSKVKGQIVLPSDPSYNEVRQIWNAMIERRPALIVRCAEADDVPPAIAFARENGLEISIRGAGHNIAGNAVCDNA